MGQAESLSHSRWGCKSHVVLIPKCRRKTLYARLRCHLGEVFRTLAEQKESRIPEGHVMPDHVDMLIAIPPKFAVSQVIGFINDKSAIHLARVYGERKRNFVGQSFRARGYFVSTVGRDEAMIRRYIQAQEKEISASINSTCGAYSPPLGGSRAAGRISDPAIRFERLTNKSPRLRLGIVTSLDGRTAHSARSGNACAPRTDRRRWQV